MPSIGIEAGVDGTDAHLAAKATGYLFDEFGMSEGGAVHAHLVGSGIEQAFHIGQFVDAAAHGEGDIDFLCHLGHHLGEGLAALKAGCDVEEHQLVGTGLAVGLAQGYGVARLAQVHEVGSFHGLSVLDVQTGYDCCASGRRSSSSLILPS